MTGKTLAELVKRGDIRPFKAEEGEIAALLEIAERDLKRAERNLSEGDRDWALAVAYNSLLQAARAWMLHKGYRPSLGEGHAAVIQFAIATLAGSFGKDVLLLDALRKKRHAAVYERAGAVTEYEADYAVKTAKRFLGFVRAKIG